MSLQSIAGRMCAAVTLGVALMARAASGATFTVTSTGDAGDAAPGNGLCATAASTCTIRAAIQEANALAGADTIAFAILSGPQSIAIFSALPPVTDPATIDGTTQPGYAGYPIIALSGVGLPPPSGLVVSAGSSTIRGLVIKSFASDGVRLVSGGGNTVERNFIGTNIAGTAASANLGSGLVVEQSSGNVIRYNLISGNVGDINNSDSGGIVLASGASDNLVASNLIGTDIAGINKLGNLGRGIAVRDAPDNTFRGNVISANFGSGFRVYGAGSTGNLIEGNYIGIAIDRTLRGLGNFAGVQLRSDLNVVRGNLIAGNEDSGVLLYEGTSSNNVVQGNVIAYNSQNGVAVFSGRGNRISGNAIYANRLEAIDLSDMLGQDPSGVSPENLLGDGVTPNDANDPDTGQNDRQNYPEIQSAGYAGGLTNVAVTLNSVPSSQFDIDFYASLACDASGHGEGQYPLGALRVATNGSGNASVSVAGAIDLRGYFLTVTATSLEGSTSEMSACRLVQ
ncbi:MAG: right-handed parallel beta-helix repeat-containing protein [Acidobacteria bacterium]|nr:right-handed parallel beta-helix repeat-containing protein [Acidobacteriota bacterium]